jgi:hypothetical protein
MKHVPFLVGNKLLSCNYTTQIWWMRAAVAQAVQCLASDSEDRAIWVRTPAEAKGLFL